MREHWSWAGIQAEAITSVSPFGHLIIRDCFGAFWYLDTELHTLTQVATDYAGLLAHWDQPDVLETWEAERLVQIAREEIGEPDPGHCYSMSIETLVDGAFAKRDFWHPRTAKLVATMGDFEQRTRSWPSGAVFRYKVVGYEIRILD